MVHYDSIHNSGSWCPGLGFCPGRTGRTHEITRNLTNKTGSCSCIFVDRFAWRAAICRNRTTLALLTDSLPQREPLSPAAKSHSSDHGPGNSPLAFHFRMQQQEHSSQRHAGGGTDRARHSVVALYQTSFEQGSGMETFTLVEHGGRWYLAKYYVTSNALK